jgi:Flagellar-associated PapD-like
MSNKLLTQSSNFYKPVLQSNGIRVEPSETIKFEAVRSGTRYVLPFVLRNTTDNLQRIRIQPPKRDCFTLKYIPGPPVAPGLEVHGEIECQIPDDTTDFIFTETIIASMGTHSVGIRIHASKVCANVEFDNYVNLGCALNSDKELSKDILFQNKGKICIKNFILECGIVD